MLNTRLAKKNEDLQSINHCQTVISSLDLGPCFFSIWYFFGPRWLVVIISSLLSDDEWCLVWWKRLAIVILEKRIKCGHSRLNVIASQTWSSLTPPYPTPIPSSWENYMFADLDYCSPIRIWSELVYRPVIYLLFVHLGISQRTASLICLPNCFVHTASHVDQRDKNMEVVFWFLDFLHHYSHWNRLVYKPDIL